MFMFDRLAINFNTVVGIMLSLVAGTIFSYLEYKAKKNKSATSTNKNPCDEEHHERLTDDPHPSDDMAINLSKCVASSLAHSRAFFWPLPSASHPIRSFTLRDHMFRLFRCAFESNDETRVRIHGPA